MISVLKRSGLLKIGLGAVFVLLASSVAYALEPNEYRTIAGLDSRRLVWFIAQMHLYFAAFVLGVPLFAVIIEIVGWKSGDVKYDKLAYEFTSLLSVAYATTAAIGGLLAFTFMTLYPTFFGYMVGLFKPVFFIYALLFFGETFCLYIYYYGWGFLSGGKEFPKWLQITFKAIAIGVLAATIGFFFDLWGPGFVRADMKAFKAFLYGLPLAAAFWILKDKKSLHIFVGIILNIIGTLLMQLANSWAGFMMGPVGVTENGDLTEDSSMWQIYQNILATPVVIHRILGNLAFGGLIGGAYAAIKFIGAQTPEEKAHYDWMGYTANFVAIVGLIPLPFAGYYLGREVYSTSAVMGNNMMGGAFSWTFIIQAILVGTLFLVSSYYLWCGMTRIPGAERYYKYIKYLLGAIVISFAIWLTPHNLPLKATEIAAMGGSQYHPVLKFLGLMPAKNAVVNLIIISLFISFVLYRRGNKSEKLPISQQGMAPKIVIPICAAIAIAIVGNYAYYCLTMSPDVLDLPPDTAKFFRPVGILLSITCIMVVVTAVMTLYEKGEWGQAIYLVWTIFSVTFFLGVWGFVVMEKASPFLRNVAVAQFLQLIACIIVVSSTDLFLWKGAKEVGPLQWGKMTIRSQYALLLLALAITMNMGLMGFIRSGLRADWHIFGVMRDTSPWSYTPSNFAMTYMVGLAVFTFMVGVAFMFWLGGLIGKKGDEAKTESASAGSGASENV